MANFIIPVPIEPKPRFESWALRDYWVEPPKIIPPAPPQKYVPAPDVIAFEAAPRDSAYYQDHPAKFYPFPPVKPPAPPAVGSNVTPRFDPPWTPRDYTTRIDPFWAVFRPPAPPPFPAGAFPPWLSRWYYPWAHSEYQPLQDRFSWISGTSLPTVFVPGPELFAFDALPPDQTALKMSVDRPVRFDALLAPSLIVPPAKRIAFAERPRDMTPLLLSQFTYTAFSGIPIVPTYSPFPTFDYEPEDQTAVQLAAHTFVIPPPRVPFIFPVPQPYLEPPPWNQSQYPNYQDQFSALAPKTSVFPKGLIPPFTYEALLRDIPRPQNFPQTFRIPPPPPRVAPTPATYVEWKDWAPRDYDAQQSVAAPWLIILPPPVGFRVMAVTAGVYRGIYYYPGDVFDLVSPSDYSDSTKNYQITGNIYATGWMLKVPAATALYQSIPNQSIPTFPVLDPNRRWGAM